MEGPDLDTAHRLTEAVLSSIYSASADEAGNVAIDPHAALFALQMAGFHIMSNMVAAVDQPGDEVVPDTQPAVEPQYVRRQRRAEGQ